jgi:hypothetical protein
VAGRGLEESGAAEVTLQSGVKSIYRIEPIDPVTQPKRVLEEERLGTKGRLEYLRAIFAKRMAPSRQGSEPSRAESSRPSGKAGGQSPRCFAAPPGLG